MKSLSLAKPHVIIMVGLPGSGKSFFAEKFAETFHTPLVSEQKINQLTNESTTELADLQLTELLKTNQTIIFEGASSTRTDRMALTKKARSAGYEPLIVWVQVDPTTARERSVEAKQASLSPEQFDILTKRFTPPNSTERPLVISGKHTYASQAKVVLKKLSSPRAEISIQTAPPARPERRNIAIR